MSHARLLRRAAAGALAMVAVAVAVPATAVPPTAVPPPDPAFLPTAVEQYPKGRQRGLDQTAHPDFLARTDASGAAALDLPVNVDPYRRDWAPARGTQLPVAFPNRYGAVLRGTLYAPRGAGEHPGIVLLTGGNGPEVALQEFSQGLAEAGYLVLGLQAQGDTGSDAAPPDPVPVTPENEYCRPGNFAGWQDAQEMGIREQSTCAGGYEPEAPPPDPGGTVGGASSYYLGVATDSVDFRALEGFYETVRARKAFAALDAAAWLRSPANPLRDRLSDGPLGIAGHSLGAHGALLVGNGDPLRRFGAVVAWDGFGRLTPTAVPRVPTLFFSHEIDTGLPRQRALDPAQIPAYRDAELFRAAGVRTGVVVPDGSTHQDFTFLHYPLLWPVVATLGACPDCLPAVNSSRDGARVALHYTRAWFDRELRGADGAGLTVRTFPASADDSSIGQGTYDPPTRSNVPYAIGGEPVAEHLSPLLPSWLSECPDLRKGC